MPPKPTLVNIYSYPLLSDPSTTNTTTAQQGLSLLRHYLPTSIPLYRRLQFGRFFPDTQLLTNLPSLTTKPNGREAWFLAFIDRTCRPETECWIFASWEHASSSSFSEDVQDELMYSLFHRIASLPVPASIHVESQLKNDSEADHSGTTRTDYAAHMASPAILLCGAIHELTIPAVQRTGLIKHVLAAGLVPNHEYIFNLDDEPMKGLLEGEFVDRLPEGLRWGELESRHLGLVRSRTQIPRQERTLAILPSVAIFPTSASGDGNEEPIAWAFVGLDGSVTTLHVEPEWRGKGFAKQITTKLFRDKMDMFWEEGQPRVAHDYVIKGNVASVGVSNSIGGKSEWDVFWVRVDLSVGEK